MPTARTAPGPVTAPTDALPPRQRSLYSSQWFSQMSESPRSAALGLRPCRVMSHVLGAPMRRDPARVRFDRLSLADAAVAAGCVDGDAGAWAMVYELAPLLERALLSLCDREHPHVAARRFLDGVRAATETDDASTVNLRRYSGERPLRVWLVDRLLGSASADLRRLRPANGRAVASRRLRLAYELIESKRDRARAMAAAMTAPAGVERLLADPTV